MSVKNNDIFANIAQGGINFRGKSLIEQVPPQLEEKYLNTGCIDREGIFTPAAKINNKDQLYEELDKQRKLYAKYLENHAPKINNMRIRNELDTFDWRIETLEDKADFQGVLQGKGCWEKVSIPHYGEPLGQAVTYYRTRFSITDDMLKAGALYVCFKAVDYKAHVFVNGNYLGSHEGFFAPFEFDFTACAVAGQNTLLVKVENDFICGGNSSPTHENLNISGDKIYAATGVGYDDPYRGWHHCPPGMGIYQKVYVEARPEIFVENIFVRPYEDLQGAEVWLEVFNRYIKPHDIKFRISVYGRNFLEAIIENMEYSPVTGLEVGMGDSFTEAKLRAEGKINSSIPLQAEKGRNKFIVPVDIPDTRLWELDSPWLYQINVELLVENIVIDTFTQHFGMRYFKMDTEDIPKGALYLNGVQIRLRGANTMGHEQQCVIREDYEQLRDDILLAKICNMNFLRLTQRPVQPEVYDYCDMLGLMTQTDLPLFGVLSRNQFCEGVRQAEEMERLVRCHPCNIMVTYINEPFPNAKNKPHRNLTRPELTEFFKAADILVRLNNPDRVIKHVDGDYDPPSETLPDNHCYPAWYNGHGIDIGKLNKGYWMPVKPDWFYGCGEFGAEGLDFIEVMKKYYPASWLPQTSEEEKHWSPNQIIGAQTGRFHYFFFETPETMEDWVKESHKHQAWATKIMTEAFRRDSRMTTFAIHLFIDAFPSGWMKTIMDVDRSPKPAYFAYRNALEPLMVNIRCDRFKFFSEEEVVMEAWICNDGINVINNASLLLQIINQDEIIAASVSRADIPCCSSKFQGFIRFKLPKVYMRTTIKIQMGLQNEKEELLNDTEIEIEVFPDAIEHMKVTSCYIPGNNNGPAVRLAKELGLKIIGENRLNSTPLIIIDDWQAFIENSKDIKILVSQGAKLVFVELSPGEYDLWGTMIKIKECSMLPLHFVGRNTGHTLVEGLRQDDFKLWYDNDKGYITPLLESTFETESFNEILISGNINAKGEWDKALAAGEKRFGKGNIIICQLKLAGRTKYNPVANIFANRLIEIRQNHEVK